MSYILDALRKAERERQVTRVPTLATAHGGTEPIRRRPWAWVFAGGLALSALVAFGFFWAGGRSDAVREAARPSVTAAAPPTSGARAAASAESASQPVEREEPAPVVAPAPAIARPPGGHASTRPRVTPLSPATKAPRAALSAEDGRRAPSTAGLSDALPARQVAAAPTSPIPSPSSEPATRPRPTGDPAGPTAVVNEAGRPVESEAVPRLTLDVLVYSEAPAERLVFINGRKYVEGQTLDGDAVVEQITPDGAILRHQGRRLELRPKLNPYARPRSP